MVEVLFCRVSAIVYHFCSQKEMTVGEQPLRRYQTGKGTGIFLVVAMIVEQLSQCKIVFGDNLQDFSFQRKRCKLAGIADDAIDTALRHGMG